MKFNSVRVGEEFAFVLGGKCGTYIKLSETEAVEIENPHGRGQHIRIGGVVGMSATAPIAECAYCDRPLLGGGYGFFAGGTFPYHRACSLANKGYGPTPEEWQAVRPDEPDRDGTGAQSERGGGRPRSRRRTGG